MQPKGKAPTIRMPLENNTNNNQHWCRDKNNKTKKMKKIIHRIPPEEISQSFMEDISVIPADGHNQLLPVET